MNMKQTESTLVVNKETTPQMVDQHMCAMFSKHVSIDVLHIDASQCPVLSFTKVKSILPVIQKYRSHSRKYLKQTRIITSNRWVARIIRTVLPLVKPEQPVSVNICNNKQF